MQDLIKQEQFELEVLDRLNTKKALGSLVLGGGTCLRLCLGMDRFSVDLDFWITRRTDTAKLFAELKDYFAQFYQLSDCADKFNTLLFELKSADFPRSLKIEIRKEVKKVKIEQAIAYSKYSNTQVLLNIVSAPDMMRGKIAAFLDRGEIRDAFDMEFLLKKGVELSADKQDLKKILKKIDALTKKDYTQKLGSLLEEGQRRYYAAENFNILRSAITGRI